MAEIKCSFLVLLFIGFLSALSVNVKADERSLKKISPTCYIRGIPPNAFLLVSIPSEWSDKNNTYNGHYCFSNMSTLFCLKPPYGYHGNFKCTWKLNDGVHIKCNMTEIIRKLANLNINNLCMAVSMKNKTSTSYTNSKCCNIKISPKFSAIEDLRVFTTTKSQINATWKSPSDILDNNIKAFLKYFFFLTRLDVDYTKAITVEPSSPRSIVLSYVFAGLMPYTRYQLTGKVFMTGVDTDGGDESKAVQVTTLPDAPSEPPVILESPVVISLNSSSRTVFVKWRHPAKDKINGLIIQSIMEYQRQTDNINKTLPFYEKCIVNGNRTNATIEGLFLDEDYLLTMRSCTTPDDCSKPSDHVTIKGIIPKSGQFTQKKNPRSVMIVVFVALGSIFAVIVLGGICCIRYRRNQDNGNENQPRPPLPEITLDEDYAPVAKKDENKENIYTKPYVNDNEILNNGVILQASDLPPAYQQNIYTVQEHIPLC